MKVWGWLFIPVLMLGAGCTVFNAAAPSTLATWQAVAKERNLAGESVAKLSRCTQLAANERRRHELPDLLKLSKNMPPQQATGLFLDILRESVAVASMRLLDENDTLLSVATRLSTGELDHLTAVLLAEKDYLDSISWKDADVAARETELHRNLTALLGKIPDSDSYFLAMPEPIRPTPLPEIIRKNYGSDPAALLKFANVILALPAEFARQLIASPDTPVTGVWLEARCHAAMCAVAFSEHFLNLALQAYRRDPSPENLYSWRKWFYRRQQALADVPLIRGSQNDIRSLEALIQLHNYL